MEDGVLPQVAKGLPPGSGDGRVGSWLASRPRLSQLTTPVLVLDDAAMDWNAARLQGWAEQHGLSLAPHGKTTMAPAIWRRQLAAGAWGVTVATSHQLRVAVAAGITTIQVANALVDPVALRWLAQACAQQPELQVLLWVDSLATVAAMEASLDDLPGSPVLDVLVELGGTGGRTGARGTAAALTVAAAVARSSSLRLVGATGYEGALVHDLSDAARNQVRDYLHELRALHLALLDAGTYETAGAFLSCGGSTWFDEVAAVLAPAAQQGTGTTVLLRSGAYIVHDEGYYRSVSPFDRSTDGPFQPAMRLWSRVISAPEPGLALLDAGRRDLPLDQGMPVPLAAAAALGDEQRGLHGVRISEVNDQHAFLRWEAPEAPVRVGEVVLLALSHPCTAFDKWRWVPVLTTFGEPDPLVVDVVETCF